MFYGAEHNMGTQIVAVSDTHGLSQVLPLLEKAYPHASAYLHMGDLEDDPRLYPKWIFVRGNNDYMFGMEIPDARVVRVNDTRIYMTHSHRFGYSRREERIAAAAKENDCQIALFGHTHVPVARKIDGIWVVNPGSVAFPRDGKSSCYAVIDIEEDGTIEPHLLHEEEWPFRLPAQNRRWFW